MPVDDKEGKAMLERLRKMSLRNMPERMTREQLDAQILKYNRKYITPVVIFEERQREEHREPIFYVRGDIQP